MPGWQKNGGGGGAGFGGYIIKHGVRPCGWPASIFSTSRIILLNTSTAVWTHQRKEKQSASGGLTYSCSDHLTDDIDHNKYQSQDCWQMFRVFWVNECSSNFINYSQRQTVQTSLSSSVMFSSFISLSSPGFLWLKTRGRWRSTTRPELSPPPDWSLYTTTTQHMSLVFCSCITTSCPESDFLTFYNSNLVPCRLHYSLVVASCRELFLNQSNVSLI